MDLDYFNVVTLLKLYQSISARVEFTVIITVKTNLKDVDDVMIVRSRDF